MLIFSSADIAEHKWTEVLKNDSEKLVFLTREEAEQTLKEVKDVK